MGNDQDEIRRQVQERIDQEASKLPVPEEEPKITSKFIQECLFANERGDGILYSTLFRDKFLYVGSSEEWFEWAGHYWSMDKLKRSLNAVERVAEIYLDERQKISTRINELSAQGDEENKEEIKNLKNKQGALLKRVSQLRGDKRRNACLKFAYTNDHPLAVKGEEFDDKPLLFPCANGVIDLETGILNPGRPDDYLSLASPISFLGIDTPAPLWEKTLLEILSENKELVDYLQRLFGYCLTGLVGEKVFPLLYGKTGWNGRSTIIETISHIMGDLSSPIPAEMLLSEKFSKSTSGPSSDIMSLKGIRMAVASETDEHKKFSASKVKWLTGKDKMIGRTPYDKYPTKFNPSHKLILMTNSLPQAPPNDKAFWERLHVVPFLLSYVKRDPQERYERRANLDLDRQLAKEYPGILAWLVRGCIFWQKQGLNPPSIVIEEGKKYQRNEDILADFIEQCCILEPMAKEKASQLFGRFKEWYKENISQEKDPNPTWFGRLLSQKFDKTKSEGCNVYHGISLITQKQGVLEG